MTVASRVSAHSGLLELVMGGGEVFTETVGPCTEEEGAALNREILTY
jgi:hypothetical protein